MKTHFKIKKSKKEHSKNETILEHIPIATDKLIDVGCGEGLWCDSYF